MTLKEFCDCIVRYYGEELKATKKSAWRRRQAGECLAKAVERAWQELERRKGLGH